MVKAWVACKPGVTQHHQSYQTLNFQITKGTGICQPRGYSQAFDTHTVSYQNVTSQRILLEKQAHLLICQGQEKIEESCKGTFLILYMHFFYCLSSQNYIVKSGATAI